MSKTTTHSNQTFVKVDSSNVFIMNNHYVPQKQELIKALFFVRPYAPSGAKRDDDDDDEMMINQSFFKRQWTAGEKRRTGLQGERA